MKTFDMAIVPEQTPRINLLKPHQRRAIREEIEGGIAALEAARRAYRQGEMWAYRHIVYLEPIVAELDAKLTADQRARGLR